MSATATKREPMTCDGSPQSTTQILGRLQAVLGRLAGHQPPPHEPDDAPPAFAAEDDEE